MVLLVRFQSWYISFAVCKGRFFRVFFFFFQIVVFYRFQKAVLIDFSEKRAPTKAEYLLTVCRILRNFTVGNPRKFTVSFAFCTLVDVIKH